MQVRNGLPSGSAYIDADVKAIAGIALLNRFLGLIQQRQQCQTFVSRSVKKKFHVSFGDNKAMTWRDGKPVLKP
ncbi:hypothetical protein LMG28138_05582 [Pararobbsia alpina]|uniref:Uncharacterized protein n=1 Tax=Pararobbsia alpina TaxID=621374 RepID=A0A6S7BLK8_9BURK|nr:hypothetical protein LMG28138_05582 [Pararobbsia alpina]